MEEAPGGIETNNIREWSDLTLGAVYRIKDHESVQTPNGLSTFFTLTVSYNDKGEREVGPDLRVLVPDHLAREMGSKRPPIYIVPRGLSPLDKYRDYSLIT